VCGAAVSLNVALAIAGLVVMTFIGAVTVATVRSVEDVGERVAILELEMKSFPTRKKEEDDDAF
jgi:hypothetical protein